MQLIVEKSDGTRESSGKKYRWRGDDMTHDIASKDACAVGRSDSSVQWHDQIKVSGHCRGFKASSPDHLLSTGNPYVLFVSYPSN